MKLWFDEGGMTGDFNACCDPPEDWMDLDPDDELGLFVWFRAYTTKHLVSSHEELLWQQGYDYDCFVEVETEACFNEYELAHFPARDVEEAERMLQACADAIYGKEQS